MAHSPPPSGPPPEEPRTGTPPGHLSPALGLLVEQLWQPAVDAGVARAGVDLDPDSGWRDAERYRLLPSARQPRLLVPDGRRALMRRSLTNYRGLRPPRVNLQRTVLGAALRAGLPVGRGILTVQQRVGAEPAEGLPLAALGRSLGIPALHASIGVRTGANRKATLQLVDGAGEPVGFAKFGWNRTSSEFVRTEGATLAELGAGSGRVRTPRLLSSGTWWDRPYVVTAPLPLGCRGVRSDAPAPSPRDLAELCPLSRSAPVSDTAHFRGLRSRLGAMVDDPVSGPLATQALALAEELAGRRLPLPVARRWHGDLTPWNAARDDDGVLWLWDWESSEHDVIAGLDSLHWSVSVRREQGGRVDGELLGRATEDAGPHLVAFGLGPEARAIAAAVYATCVAERACSLAVDTGGWARLWIQPEQIDDVLRSARALVERHPGSA